MKSVYTYLISFWILYPGIHSSGALANIGTPDPEPRNSPDLPPESCSRMEKDSELPMISIRPISTEYSLTREETPTILFYVPYVAETGQFIVYQNNTSEALYQATFSLPETTGIVSLTINANLPADEYHNWYFRVNCTTLSGGSGEETISGWIYRQADQVVAQDVPFYYDEIAAIAQSYDEQLNQDWLALLTEIDRVDAEHPDGDIDLIDLVDYGQLPILGPVNLLEETARN